MFFDTYVTIKDREGHPDMDDTLLEKLDEMLTTYGVPHAFTLPHEKTMEDCPEATLEVAYDSSDDITFSLVYAVYAAGANSKLTVGGTVKLVIINSSFKKPSEALVDQVQTAVDPLQNVGEGVGIAPIGHVVRVEGVGEDTINLSFDLYYQREWSWDDVSAYVTEAINGYFLELAQSWADQNEALVIRISQVESRLLGITGILDIANTKINGEAANCTLTLDHIPVLGTIEPGTIVING